MSNHRIIKAGDSKLLSSSFHTPPNKPLLQKPPPPPLLSVGFPFEHRNPRILAQNFNRGIAMDESQAQPVCAVEALDLLNCVTESAAYDQEKCIRLLNSLRDCVLNKKVKKFSLAEQNQPEAAHPNNSKDKN